MCAKYPDHGRVRKILLYLRLPCLSAMQVWMAVVGEELVCERKPHNSQDCYAVAVAFVTTLLAREPLAKESTVTRVCGDWAGNPLQSKSVGTWKTQTACNALGDTFWITINSTTLCMQHKFSDQKYFVALIIGYRKYFEYGHHCAPKIF